MSSINVNHWTSSHFVSYETDCRKILEDVNVVKGIPSLNAIALHELQDGQLVRFQGMIQDMYNPEYYFQSYEVKNTVTGESNIRCGMYKDTASCEANEDIVMDSEKNKNSERQTLVVISIPGLNDWAKEKSTNSGSTSVPTQSTSLKRTHEESGDEQMDTSVPLTKKEKSEESSTKHENEMILSRDHFLNFPIPNNDGKACILKIYDESAQYKLNQVLDIIGFVSLDPLLSTICNSDEIMNDTEVQTHNPPPSLVPRLHAIKVTELTKISLHSPEILSRAEAIRGDLHMILSQLLFGDDLAANYVICHLISSIYTRKDYLSLGNFPLNITNFPIQKYQSFPKDFYDFLSGLVPKSYYFECTLESLNDSSLIPKKDYESNRLTSGILQLTNNTHLVIDETKLTSGQLSPAGRQNHQAITDLIATQKVTYDFKYYTMEYETDIPVLIFSETKSFIPCILQVPLEVDPEAVDLYPQVLEAAKHYLRDETRLNDIRQYLNTLRNTDFQLNEDILNVIQDDFVQLRQSNKTVNADNLHSLMVFARFMSLSYGHNSLTLDCWKRTLQIEMRRLTRLPPRKK